MKKIILFIIFILLTGCTEERDIDYKPVYSSQSLFTEQKEYIIGIHPLHNPKRLHEIFGPIAEYLSAQIGMANFRIEASRNYSSFDKKLYAGKFHFALPNPYQTVRSLDKGYRVFGKMADDENFRGIFLVRKNSNIKNVSDLKGHAVSFPAPTALAATMMPQYYLQMNGINVMKDIEIKYVGSQESSIMNVMLGNTLAGATWPPPWEALSKERPELKKELKVIWQTPSLPNNGLVARTDVKKEILDQVKMLLLNLHQHQEGRDMLKKMELSRFEEASDDSYRPVVKFLQHFNKTVRPIEQ